VQLVCQDSRVRIVRRRRSLRKSPALSTRRRRERQWIVNYRPTYSRRSLEVPRCRQQDAHPAPAAAAKKKSAKKRRTSTDPRPTSRKKRKRLLSYQNQERLSREDYETPTVLYPNYPTQLACDLTSQQLQLLWNCYSWML
jgi:hypothetical protein